MLHTTLKAGLLSLGLVTVAALTACQMDETVPVTPSPTMAKAKPVASPGTTTAMVYPSGPYDETPITPRETAGAPAQD